MWDLAVEQHAWWRAGPHGRAGYLEQCRQWGQVRVPKVGWVRFRWSRSVPEEVKSFRITRDRGVAVSAALSTGKPLTVPGLSQVEQRRLRHLEREFAQAWKGPTRRLEDKAPVRVEKVDPACGYARDADVNAARNIAARRAMTARGGHREAGPVNREPQLLLQSA